MPYVENKGVKIHYKMEGSGPALVLVHPGLTNLEDWYDFGYVTQLKEDYQLILVDLRGHGRSDHPQKPEMYSYDLMVGDIVRVLDKLRIDRFHAAGFSFGGWFVYGLAEVVPERLLSMIIMDGVPGVADADVFRYIMNNDEAFLDLAENVPSLLRERLLAVDKKNYLLIVDSVVSEAPRIIQRIEKLIEHVKVPCLVITSEYEKGSKDFELLKKTADSISGSVFIKKHGFTHPEILYRSDGIIPHIKEFLKGLK